MAQVNKNGTQDNDRIDASNLGPGDFAVIYDFDGDDLIIGSNSGDRFNAGRGINTIFGGGGDDILFAGNSRFTGNVDYFHGGTGHDRLVLYVDPSTVTLTHEADGTWIARTPDTTIIMDGVETVNVTWGFTTSTRTLSTVANDFNGDGMSDILWGTSSVYAPQGALSQWHMNGATYLDGATFGLHDTAYAVSHTADFNGDGKADILWSKAGGGAAIWLMDGLTGIGGQDIALPGNDTAWSIGGTGDFNGDGKADILFTKQLGAYTQVYLQEMNGLSAIGGGSIATVGADWSIAGTGDFNGDDKADILWQRADGTVSVWTMDGTSYIGGGTIGAPGASWKVAGTGDFNDDGVTDILFRNDSDGGVAIWTMRNGKAIAGTSLYNPGTEWDVAAVGDYNGDGISDILWRHVPAAGDTAAEVKLWTMAGSPGTMPTVKQDSSLGTISTEWQVIG